MLQTGSFTVSSGVLRAAKAEIGGRVGRLERGQQRDAHQDRVVLAILRRQGASAAELQQVCFTGAWVSAIASSRSPVQLSPGDIDEALATVLSPLSPDEADTVQSTSFERTDALRTGLLDGLPACLR